MNRLGACLGLGLLVLVAALSVDYYIQHSHLQPLPKKTVIVVGGGLAGVSAAIEAHSAGSHVIVLEKEKDLGGNSAKASSGINGVGSQTQKKRGVNDSVDLFVKDVVEVCCWHLLLFDLLRFSFSLLLFLVRTWPL